MSTALQIINPATVTHTIAAHVADFLPQEAMRSRFAAVLANQVRSIGDLQKCTQESVLFAVAKIAQLQLDPAIPNEAWLVSYYNKQKGQHEAQCLIGYGGLRKLALRSPDVQDIFCAAVHDNDEYESPATPTQLPTHRRPAKFRPRGKAIGYYAAALLTSGHWRVIEMSREEVKAHRDLYSRSAQSQFWNEGKPDHEGLTNFDKMALKTVMRQLCSARNLSLTAELAMAEQQEDAYIEMAQAPEPARTTPMLTPAEEITRGQQSAADLFPGGMQAPRAPSYEEALASKSGGMSALYEQCLSAMETRGMPRRAAEAYMQRMERQAIDHGALGLDEETMRALLRTIPTWTQRASTEDVAARDAEAPLREGASDMLTADEEQEELPI
jgi:phage RecT family recombinase